MICGALVLAVWVLINLAEGLFGLAGTINTSDYDPKLTGIARQLVPVIDAAEDYRELKGEYPDEVTLLQRLPRDFHVRSRFGFFMREIDWHYTILDTHPKRSYVLSVPLGWDPVLLYNSESRVWTVDPGNGGGSREIKLKVP